MEGKGDVDGGGGGERGEGGGRDGEEIVRECRRWRRRKRVEG